MQARKKTGSLRRPKDHCLGSQRAEALADLVDQRLGPASSREDLLEGATRWLLAARDPSRPESVGRVPAPVAISILQRALEKRNVDLERFYPALLEKILYGDADEAVKASARPSARERILDAALDVFSDKGFHMATVDEIAERAEVGKGTLYRYFSNKEGLFTELVRLRLEDLEIQAGKVLDGHDDVLTMIAKYVRVYFEFFDRNQRLYHLIAQESLEVGDQVHDLYFKKVMRRIPVLKLKIHEATQKGLFKDVDFHTVFYGVMGFIHGVIQKWLARDCSYSLMDELPTVLDVLFYGFVNRPKFG
jgi:AcrR family transcriptional regulator